MECPEVIRITDWQEQQDGYSHRMKRLFQIVAFVVIALLAVPPSLAESLCITASEKRANMECCDVDHVSSVSPLPDVIQNCDEGCCSIAPKRLQVHLQTCCQTWLPLGPLPTSDHWTFRCSCKLFESRSLLVSHWPAPPMRRVRVTLSPVQPRRFR